MIKDRCFSSCIKTVAPAVIKRIRRLARAICWITERAEFLFVVFQPRESGLYVPKRQPGGWKNARIVLSILANNVAPPSPPKAGDVRHVHWITASFVVHVAEQGFQVTRLSVDLLRDRELKGAFAGEIPTRGTMTFIRFGKTRAIGALLGETRHIVRRGDDLCFDRGEVFLINFLPSNSARSSGKSERARGPAIPFEQSPPGPASRI